MNLKRVSMLWHAFRFFQDAALVYPVYVILLQQHGLGAGGIALILALWAGSMLVFELPSGFLADRWSRRKTLLLGMLAKAIGFTCWLIWPEPAGFALGFILWGLQEAFVSGTADAYLFGLLAREGADEQYEALSARAAVWSRIALVLSMLGGAWLAARDSELCIALSALAMLLSGTCLWLMPEIDGARQPRSHQGQVSAGPTMRELAASLHTSLRLPGMRPSLLFGCGVLAGWGMLDEYDTAYGLLRGVPLELVGLWGCLRFAAEGLGCALLPWLQRHGVLTGLRSMGLWSAISACILGAGIAGPDLLLPAYFAFFAMLAPLEIAFGGQIQRRIPDTGRASFTSLVSLLTAGAGILIGLALGAAASLGGLPLLFATGAGLVLLASLAGCFVRRADDGPLPLDGGGPR